MILTLRFLLFHVLFNAYIVGACDILGATGCPKEPENVLKTEDFFEYCNQYKFHLECVFEMYEGCDKKGKYAMAMTSMVKGISFTLFTNYTILSLYFILFCQFDYFDLKILMIFERLINEKKGKFCAF